MLTYKMLGQKGKIPIDSTHGPLAQVVEHLTFNQVVRGSSPRWLIKLRDKVEAGLEPVLMARVAH